VTNGDGSVELTDVRTNFLTIKTGDGQIAGTGIVAGNGSIQSGDGNVALTFAPLANVTVGVKTDSSDSTVTAVSPLQLVQIGDSNSERQVRFGAGEGRLDVKTDDGSVTLARGGI